MSRIKLSGPKKSINAEITIGGSKSISNRVLLIQALCNDNFDIDNLSDSDDTQTLKKLITVTQANPYDCHHAGTTFRFLTAYFAIQNETQILTGSSRMKQRPIGPLVDALNFLGADIEYLENEGFPPLKLNPFKNQKNSQVIIKADISSQFISALCLIGPALPQGIKITFKGDLVSKPYLLMTLSIMKTFGIKSLFENNKIVIEPQKYQATNYLVESDWSSASYHFAIAALVRNSEIKLNYLFENSLQGDSNISHISKAFGTRTTFKDKSIYIFSDQEIRRKYAYDFIMQPDIAQTVAIMAAGLNTEMTFSGLKTLKIKETDRILALQNELKKISVQFIEKPSQPKYYKLNGTTKFNLPEFDTYQDHRMAMSFAPLAILSPIIINNPEVVSKSYPNFWKDLLQLGFIIEKL